MSCLCITVIYFKTQPAVNVKGSEAKPSANGLVFNDESQNAPKWDF